MLTPPLPRAAAAVTAQNARSAAMARVVDARRSFDHAQRELNSAMRDAVTAGVSARQVAGAAQLSVSAVARAASSANGRD